MECQGNILIKHSSKEVNVVIVIVVFFSVMLTCVEWKQSKGTPSVLVG